MKRHALAAAILLAACAGSKSGSFGYCKEMRKTGGQIEDLETQNKELKGKMDAVPPGTDSSESQRYGYQQTIDRNNEKIKDLKSYNETNARNCGPARSPSTETTGGY